MMKMKTGNIPIPVWVPPSTQRLIEPTPATSTKKESSIRPTGPTGLTYITLSKEMASLLTSNLARSAPKQPHQRSTTSTAGCSITVPFWMCPMMYALLTRVLHPPRGWPPPQPQGKGHSNLWHQKNLGWRVSPKFNNEFDLLNKASDNEEINPAEDMTYFETDKLEPTGPTRGIT